jgi:hypothetical protein
VEKSTDHQPHRVRDATNVLHGITSLVVTSPYSSSTLRTYRVEQEQADTKDSPEFFLIEIAEQSELTGRQSAKIKSCDGGW